MSAGTPAARVLVRSLEHSLYVLRGRLPRWRIAPVELHAEAWAEAEQSRTLSLDASNGMMATARAIAAAARLLHETEGGSGTASDPK